MTLKKKLAFGLGAAVLAGSVVLGAGVANAATIAPQNAVQTGTAAPATDAKTAAVEVPAAPEGSFSWDDYIAKLTPEQQQALLTEQQAVLEKAKSEAPDFVEKIEYNITALEKAIG